MNRAANPGDVQRGDRGDRKVILRLAVFVLAALMIPFAPLPTLTELAEAATAPADNLVRVHLATLGTPESVSLYLSGSHTIEDNGKATSGQMTVQASGTTAIRVTVGGQTYSLDGDIALKAQDYSVSNLIQINGGYSYAGDLRIINLSGKLKIVNHIDMETYLMGVVPYEISNVSPMEAQKAQAIAARSYAYYKMNLRDRSAVEQDFSNTDSQSYHGYNASYGNAIAAVNATRGQLLKTMSGGNVYACFGASNGGHTEYPAASGAASSNLSYLPYKDDPYDLAASLASSDYSAKVTIPKTIQAADLKTSAAQPYKFLREKLAASGVDVNAIAAAVTVKSITLADPRYQSPDRAYTGAVITLGLPASGATAARDVQLRFSPYYISGSTVKYPFLNEILGKGSKFGVLYLRDDGSSFLLAAMRYGHGSGLSQIGASYMALQGKSATDILAFYYDLGTATQLVTMQWGDASGGATVTPGIPEAATTPLTATGQVTLSQASGKLNIRTGPGTNYPILATFDNGQTVQITGENGGWYLVLYGVTGGYVSKDYVKIVSSGNNNNSGSGTSSDTGSGTGTTTEQTGTVSLTSGALNVRSGAGLSNQVIGTLANGAAVTIIGESGGWYQIKYGSAASAWVSKDYIKVGASASSGSSGTSGTSGTSSGTTGGSTASSGSAASDGTGTVTLTSGVLNVRAGAGMTAVVIGTLANGTVVTITGESGDWYRIKYGGAPVAYVSKTYVRTSGAGAGTASSTGTASSGTVKLSNTADVLNVRSGPGTTYRILGTFAHGTKVTILSKSGDWYKISYAGGEAWVCATYVAT